MTKIKKMKKMLINLYLVILTTLLLSINTLCASLTEAEYRQIQPYLIPEDHPIKEKLDAIFTKSRAIADEKALKKAGFKWYERHSRRHIYVGKHPKLKGVLVKFLLDSNKEGNDIDMCMRRVLGAKAIREAITLHGYKKIFKVPKKWIYVLPDDPSPPDTYDRKKVILIVEKMNILDDYNNESCWKSTDYIYKDLLVALHTLISNVGLFDSVHPDNIPFCEDGKIAFIDTEHFHIWPVKEKKLTHRLPKKYREFWLNLIKKDN